MRKYVFHLYNYILHVYAGRPGGYPEAFLNKIKKQNKTKKCLVKCLNAFNLLHSYGYSPAMNTWRGSLRASYWERW